MNDILQQLWAQHGAEITTALVSALGALIVQILRKYNVQISAEKEAQLDVATRKAIQKVEEENARLIKASGKGIPGPEQARIATELIWEEIRPKGLALLTTVFGLLFKSFKPPAKDKILANIDANLASMGAGATQPDPKVPTPAPFPKAS